MSATTLTASERDGAAHAPAALADACLPAVVTWEPREREVELVPGVQELLRRHAPAHRAVRADARTLVLLLACDASSADGLARPAPGARRPYRAEDALALRLVVEQVVAFVRGALHGARVHAVMAQTSAGRGDVATRVERLRRLARHLDRRRPSAAGVCGERALALLDLLDGVDPTRAAAFAGSELAPLLDYDRRHGTHLAEVLEIALDVPNRADAARAAFMHRNTFRRYLRHALELLGDDLSDPDERLAVHVALKLVRTAPRPLTTPGGRSDTAV